MILRAVSMQAAMRCINSSVRRLEIFEEADDLGEQLARLPKARRHEQHQTGTLSGHRQGEAGTLAPGRFGSRSIPRVPVSHRIILSLPPARTERSGSQGSNLRQPSCAVMSRAEGPADARRAAP